MTLDDFDEFCATLPHTTRVVQWGGASVWKLADKMFAIGFQDAGPELYVTFKCSPDTFEMLKGEPGVRPAPYLASRGMTWLQRTSQDTLSDDALRDYIRASYALIAEKLPKKTQKELGLHAVIAGGAS